MAPPLRTSRASGASSRHSFTTTFGTGAARPRGDAHATRDAGEHVPPEPRRRLSTKDQCGASQARTDAVRRDGRDHSRSRPRRRGGGRRRPPGPSLSPPAVRRSDPAHGPPATVARLIGVTRLLTVDEVAEGLGVSKDWVWAQARVGRIPHVQLGRYRRFREEALERWLEELETRSARNGRTERTRRATFCRRSLI